ncbi:MAG: T9SS type A sorting domain-containing protein [Ignavibacteria bacterium]|nr:T9SS type A sorting domain-containing protein [Ignavibacteria bacterium]
MKKSFFILPIILILLTNFNYGQPIGVSLLWEKAVDVNTLKFTHDGNLLITGGSNNNCYPYTCGQIRTWDVADSTLLHTFENNNIGLTNDIDISSDGQTFITGHGSVYCSAFNGCIADRIGQFRFNINGSQINSVIDPGGIIYSIAYSPDETIIAAGTGYNNTGEIRIYDSNFNLLNVLPGHGLETNSLVFTNDGQYLISGGSDGNIKFWDYNNGTLVTTLQHGTYLNGGSNIKLAISPDGQYLASSGNGDNITVKIWKVSDGSLVHTFNVNNEYIGSGNVEFSPNGFYLANGLTLSGSGGLGWYGLIRFYEVSSGDLVREYIDSVGSPTTGGIRDIAFSATGNNYFAYGTGYRITGKLRLALTDLDLVLDPTIPVELSSFTAAVDNNNVTLNWQTATEKNNSGFEILRSAENDNNWNQIGFIEGHGTTTESKSYSFADINLEPGSYSYKLVQIDFDGTRNESEIVNVEIGSQPTEYSLSQNYPNPFNPSTTIQYTIPQSGNVRLIVYNSLGGEVATLVNEYKESGNYKINFDASNLSSGIYYYRLASNSFNEIKKMILLK